MTTAFADHLLPANATRFERALSAATGRLGKVPTPIDLLRRPIETPVAFLSALAWEVSTDLWPLDWPEWRKRKAVQRSIALHRVKGTIAAIQGYLDLLGADLVEAIIPPQGCYVLAGRTAAEKLAFLARFPELRIYLFNLPATGEALAQYASRHRSFVGRRFLRQSRAYLRHGRQAALVDNGVSRPVKWGLAAGVEADNFVVNVERVVIPATARRREGFIGRLIIGGSRSFAGPTKTESRILTLGVDRAATLSQSSQPIISSTQSGLDVLSLTPERVYGHGTGEVLADYVGKTARRFIRRNQAALRVFDRFWIFQADRAPGNRRIGSGTFVGRSRIGLTPFRAELRVHYPGTRAKRTIFADGGFVGQHIGRPAGRIGQVAQALRAATAARDRILFTTQCHAIADLTVGVPLDGSVDLSENLFIEGPIP